MVNASPILFFDGECGLCDATVRWYLRHDRHGRLRFAPLQGATYVQLDSPVKPAALETLVFLDQDGLHQRSDAVLRSLAQLGGGWRLVAAIGWLVPRMLRDAGYRVLARHRRRWFGGVERCQLPSATDRGRLLP